MMKKDSLIGKYVVIAIAVILTVFCCAWLLKTINSGHPPIGRFQLNKGWNVTINDTVYEDVTLSDFTFPVTEYGDRLTMKILLPESAENAMVRLWICHCAIDAYLDGEQFYTYGHKEVDNYSLVGSGFYFIELPQNYAGKELTLVLTVGEMDAFAAFDPIYLEGSSTIFYSFLSEKFMSILIGTFLLVFGAAGIVLMSFMFFHFNLYKKLIYIFWFSLLIGCWTLCNNGIIQLFCKDYIIPQAMEFVTLFAAEIPILLFIADILEGNKYLKTLNRYLTIVCSIYFAIVIITVLLGLAHFQVFLKGYHLILGFVVINVVGAIIRCFKGHGIMERYIVIGFICMSIGVIADVASYNLKKYLNTDFEYIDYGTVLGSLVMVACLFISYFAYVRAKIISSAETDMLEKLAYHDILTGAINRVKFEELLDIADESDRIYAIMYFDLNGLKQLNDSEGHSKGDELIKDFTICLSIVFQNKGEVARLGGDEFAILLMDADKEDIIGYVNSLRAYIKQHNAEAKIKLDTAFGVAFRNEVADGQSRSVCKLADSRMYEMKRKMKNARV